MTFQVFYTDRAQPNSSFVKRAWYDNDYRNLYLELSGSVYVYHNIKAGEYVDLVTADSPGTYYREHIQGQRDGIRLGPVSDILEQKVNAFIDAFVAVDTSKAARVFPNGEFSTATNGGVSFPNLVVGGNAVDEPDLLNTARVPLNKDVVVPVSDNVEYDHTVYFTLHDGEKETVEEREHVLSAASVDDAIDKMFALAELLDQNIAVKGVLVRFE